jgi:hypothetical protein
VIKCATTVRKCSKKANDMKKEVYEVTKDQIERIVMLVMAKFVSATMTHDYTQIEPRKVIEEILKMLDQE